MRKSSASRSSSSRSSRSSRSSSSSSSSKSKKSKQKIQKNLVTKVELLNNQQNRAALRPEDPVKTHGFVCNIRFGNDLPPVPFDPKFVKYPFPEDRFHKFQPTSLDRLQKAVLHVEKDVGVPINLFEALRNVEHAKSGSTVNSNAIEEYIMPSYYPEGIKKWQALDEEKKQQWVIPSQADRELVFFAKDRHARSSSAKTNAKTGGIGGFFGRKTAARSKRAQKEVLSQKSWMIKTRYLDNSFEKAVSSVVNKDREVKILAAEQDKKYAKWVQEVETNNKIPDIERIQNEFINVQKITTESLMAKSSSASSSSSSSSSSSNDGNTGDVFTDTFRSSYKKKIQKGLHPVGVYELLPDSSNVWTDDHVLIDFARKPMKKSQSLQSASSGVLMQVYDNEDEMKMMLVAPKGEAHQANVRQETKEYGWWRDYNWAQKKSERSIYNQRFLLRKTIDATTGKEIYVYNLTKGNIKLTRKVGASQRNDVVMIERRENELPMEQSSTMKRKRELDCEMNPEEEEEEEEEEEVAEEVAEEEVGEEEVVGEEVVEEEVVEEQTKVEEGAAPVVEEDVAPANVVDDSEDNGEPQAKKARVE